MALLAMGKLIQSDFDKITGVELAASIQAQADKNI